MGERLLKRGIFRTASKIYSVLGQRHGFRFECIKLGRFVSVCDQALSEQSDRIKLRQLLQLIGGTIAHSIPDAMPLKPTPLLLIPCRTAPGPCPGTRLLRTLLLPVFIVPANHDSRLSVTRFPLLLTCTL